MKSPLFFFRLFRKLTCAAFVLASLPTSGNLLAAAKPNVILFMIDDVGWEVPLADRYDTPNLEDLMTEGIRFNHCYATPVCTPSRVMLMTGKYNHRNYLDFGLYPPEENDQTIGNLMKSGGYTTLFAGKWHLGEDVITGQMGFDHSIVADHWAGYYGTGSIHIDDQKLSNQEVADLLAVRPYRPDIVSDFIIDFIDEHQNEAFFAYCPLYSVHSPEEPSPDFTGNPNDGEAVFEDMVKYMDKLIGRVVDRVDALGLRNDTIIMFTGDNGTQVHTAMIDGQPAGGGKGSMKDRGTRVPLIVSWPGTTPQGTEIDDLVDFTDFYATLADISGGVSNGTPDGVSFFPQLQGFVGAPRDYAFMFYKGKNLPNGKRRGSYWARTEQWKLYNDGRLIDVPNDKPEDNPYYAATDNAERAAVRQDLQAAFNDVDVYPMSFFNRDDRELDVGVEIQGEHYDLDSDDEGPYSPNGVTLADSASAVGGKKVVDIGDGDWVRYNRMDFGQVSNSLTIRVSSVNNGGSVEVRLNDPTGPLVTEISIPNTGGWNTYQEVTAAFAPIAGQNDVYFVFEGTATQAAELDWVRFDFVFSGGDLASEDFEAGENFSNLTTEAFGGSEAGKLSIPANGQVLAKSPLAPPIPVAGITQLDASIDVALAGAPQGSQVFEIVLQFDLADGSKVRVSGDRISLDSSHANTFVRYSSTIDVPPGAVALSEVRLAFRQQDNLSSSQVVYVDDLSVVDAGGGTNPGGPAVGLQVEAESFDAQQGVGIYGGGTQIGSIQNGDWVKYNNFDFSAPASQIEVSAASGTQGGTIELRLGSPTGTKIGEVSVTGTAGWSDFQPFSNPLTASVSGTHDLFLVFVGGGGALMDVDWFKLAEGGSDLDVRIEAEDFDAHQGVGIYPATGGGKIGNIQAGDWVRFDSFAFGSGFVGLDVSLSSAKQGGTVDFRLDSVTGPIIASATIGNTNGWGNFVTTPASVTAAVSGVRDLYLVFSGGTNSLVDVDWFEFESGTPPTGSPTLYDTDFETVNPFTNVSLASLGANGVGQITVPGSGNVTAKDTLGGASGAIPLGGATQLNFAANLQLSASEVGDVEVRMVVRFRDSGGNAIDVNADYLSVDNTFVGQFQAYSALIAVPANAVSIGDIRIRVNQNASGSATQGLYVDDVVISAP